MVLCVELYTICCLYFFCGFDEIFYRGCGQFVKWNRAFGTESELESCYRDNKEELCNECKDS